MEWTNDVCLGVYLPGYQPVVLSMRPWRGTHYKRHFHYNDTSADLEYTDTDGYANRDVQHTSSTQRCTHSRQRLCVHSSCGEPRPHFAHKVTRRLTYDP